MDNLFGKFDLANKKHIMIDIETLSTKANAVIYEIAAIEFRLNSDDDPINGNIVFADKIIDSQINIAGQSKNRDISSSTMAFHFEHNMKNFVQFISNMHTCNDLSHVLKTLAYELNRYSSEDTIVWTNSPIFDLVILRNAYESEGIEIPAEYQEKMKANGVSVEAKKGPITEYSKTIKVKGGVEVKIDVAELPVLVIYENVDGKLVHDLYVPI